MKIDTKKLKLAKLKYFDEERNGAEVSDINAYAFLAEVDGKYVNFFEPFSDEELLVFKRSIYPNVTMDGEEYGNKLIQVSGTARDGKCFIIENVDVSKLLGKSEISDEELSDYICRSSMFFIDRVELLKRKKHGSLMRKSVINKRIAEDIQMMDEVDEYFDSHLEAKKLRKIV